MDVYGEGLSTPREVNQVLNSIRFRYPGLRDYVFYPDLCLLQLISVVNPLFAGWVEHYLTVWSVVENRDGIAHEDEQKALIAELAEALKKFGASRAASVWELRAWMPGISGFEYDHLRLFETIPLQDTERYRQKRRLCSGEYWRYYFSYSSPQNVMSDEDISSIMKLAACNYAGLKKRLLDSVTSNGVSSRTWFEHILTRLSPSVTVLGTQCSVSLQRSICRCSPHSRWGRTGEQIPSEHFTCPAVDKRRYRIRFRHPPAMQPRFLACRVGHFPGRLRIRKRDLEGSLEKKSHLNQW